MSAGIPIGDISLSGNVNGVIMLTRRGKDMVLRLVGRALPVVTTGLLA